MRGLAGVIRQPPTEFGVVYFALGESLLQALGAADVPPRGRQQRADGEADAAGGVVVPAIVKSVLVWAGKRRGMGIARRRWGVTDRRVASRRARLRRQA